MPPIASVSRARACEGRSWHWTERECCSGVAPAVASLAWDPSGRRLAVAVRGNHPAAGQVALFSVTTGALIQSLTFVGWVVPPHHAEDPAVAVQFQEGGQKHAVLGALHASGRISLYPLFI